MINKIIRPMRIPKIQITAIRITEIQITRTQTTTSITTRTTVRTITTQLTPTPDTTTQVMPAPVISVQFMGRQPVLTVTTHMLRTHVLRMATMARAGFPVASLSVPGRGIGDMVAFMGVAATIEATLDQLIVVRYMAGMDR